MKKIVLYTIGSIVLGIAVLAIGVVALFWFSVVFGMRITHPIAQEVQVTNEWQRVEFKSPLKIKKQVQKISLKIEGYESKIDDSSFNTIELSDGTILNPEVFLIDENNKKYQFKDSSRTYKYSTTDSAEFSFEQKSNNFDSLPKDVKYKAIMIKSDKPFKCDITWIDNDLK